ncbi:disulfide bond formation protein B [Azorhizobium doebereinerae]|uniref:disulfide bond formation protein B n=1 Tax=Azorhizobium doebereinerae TaxID=281091 RepID=UPI00041AFCC6|nr:disulfide bond formation protein B [Azorhizobium doebereinerae]
MTALINAPTSRLLNALGLLAVSIVLIVAFVDQIVLGDLPCPLCLLQRAGFVGATLGLALNVKFGPRPSHYAVVILSAFGGALISTRQVLLHIVPGTGTYGDAFLGLHFYSWALVVYMAIILGSAVMLLFDRQFAPAEAGAGTRGGATFGLAIVALAALLALGNGVSTVLECAGGLCPDNPTSYLLLPGGR